MAELLLHFCHMDDSVESEQASRNRVLFVEDDDGVRATACELLAAHGYEVVEAIDGEDALAKLREHDGFDALVTDVRMPRMNGIELLEVVHDSYPELSSRAIVISGFVDTITAIPPHFLLLRKPCDPADLIDAIYACSGRQTLSRRA